MRHIKRECNVEEVIRADLATTGGPFIPCCSQQLPWKRIQWRSIEAIHFDDLGCHKTTDYHLHHFLWNVCPSCARLFIHRSHLDAYKDWLKLTPSQRKLYRIL